MGQSRIEIIYIASDDNARKTDMAHAGKSNAHTWATFKDFRRYAVDIKAARFLLDYYNAKGDLADTIPISTEGFTAITGQSPKSEAEYGEIDRRYWDAARSNAA